MEEKNLTAIKENTGKNECRHHWVIGIAQGPVSKGTCSECGIRREFRNYPSDHLEKGEEFRIISGKHREEKEESVSEDYLHSLSATR